MTFGCAMSGSSQVSLEDPDDTSCMTFVLKEEDHTLGNALRYMILKK